ncbi:MAG: DUF4330 domain-containing protein [Clostridia bacterium]|nr:DUF4330 domain-containing protein [Clostridia bacterium]MBQ3463870.1 DUF4330 domain-containing protein [Clostridia bacterium]MBQ6529528.1 DUF4330 domain-containing protein [Clostridia bacterium]MBQ9598193.1 DUF4330 domain-containing protein [Clostridia bacterium]MBR0088583.1 DUF4330 domain-containing protein [Clostridia bacterium]
MDKNGKIAGKISIIDILVILLVIVVIAGIAVRYGSKITTAVRSSEKFEYTMRIESVRKYTVDALEKKGRITDKKSEKDLGNIVDVRYEPAKMQSTTANGRVVMPVMPDRYTCYVTIQAVGRESDDNYVLDDSTELSVGRNVELYSKYVKTSGTIESVKVIEK